MAESVDALVSNTSGATRAGSTPALGTSYGSEAIAKSFQKGFSDFSFSFPFALHSFFRNLALAARSYSVSAIKINLIYFVLLSTFRNFAAEIVVQRPIKMGMG